jgi:hypothetical protein
MLVVRRLLPLLLLAALVPSAHALTVLTTGKVATFKGDEGMVRFGKDPALATPIAPVCPTVSRVSLRSYPQATNRVVEHLDVELPCASWKAGGGGFVYDDKTAAVGGVRKIVYSGDKLLIKFSGPAFERPTGPVGYFHVWFTVGDTAYHGRFHNFRKNDADLIVTRQVSKSAAEGEALFWSVLHGDVTGAAKTAAEERAIEVLAKASKRDKKDGRSRFLLAMMHLYRFGQMTVSYFGVDDAARAEITAANDGFVAAGPLLWDRATNRGDSRVPGFAAATTFGLGTVNADPALQAQGLADLDYAISVNEFFNIFDYIPVVQTTPPSDPLFAQLVERITGYLDDPETLSCFATQPEICSNFGLAPHNAEGALVLFGDVFAKAGNLERATFWYGLAKALGDSDAVPWKFQSVLDDRMANAEARVALYADADPSNDPPIIGAGAEACAVCHNR